MDGEVKRYGGDDFPLPEEALAEIAEVKQRLEEMAARVPLDKPWLAEDAGAWDAQSVAGWLSSNAKTRVGLEYIHKPLGMRVHRIGKRICVH